MTVKEAEKEVAKCESEIIKAHKSFCYSAMRIGSNATDKAQSAVRLSMLWLLISLLGLVMLAFGLASALGFFGIIFIIAGIVLWRKTYAHIESSAQAVESSRRELERTIHDNATI